MLTTMVSACRQAGDYLSYRDASAALGGLVLDRNTPAGSFAGLKYAPDPTTALNGVKHRCIGAEANTHEQATVGCHAAEGGSGRSQPSSKSQDVDAEEDKSTVRLSLFQSVRHGFEPAAPPIKYVAAFQVSNSLHLPISGFLQCIVIAAVSRRRMLVKKCKDCWLSLQQSVLGMMWF